MNAQLTRWDAMKLFGLLLMFIDHAGYFYFDDQEWLRGIGRACAPVFFFLAGFAPHYKTADRTLIILAALLTAFDWGIGMQPNTLNILCSILLARFFLAWLEKRDHFKLRLHEWVIGCVVMLIPTVVLFQYGSLGLLIALCGYVYKHRRHYEPQTPMYFLWFSLALYSVLFGLLSTFGTLTWIVMIASFIMIAPMLVWFANAPMKPMNMPCASLLKPCARYTAYIYVLHLLVLVALTGKQL